MLAAHVSSAVTFLVGRQLNLLFRFARRAPFGFVTAIWACGLAGGSVAKGMKKISYKGYRFPGEIIQQAIWLYLRFTLSFRDVEDLLGGTRHYGLL